MKSIRILSFPLVLSINCWLELQGKQSTIYNTTTIRKPVASIITSAISFLSEILGQIIAVYITTTKALIFELECLTKELPLIPRKPQCLTAVDSLPQTRVYLKRVKKAKVQRAH